MSKMKKVLSVLMAGAMTLAMSVSAFAATGVSAAEQTILDTAKLKAIELGVDVSKSTQYKNYYSQAETYLASNDLSEEQVNAMVTAVNEAAATAKTEMSAQGVTKLSDLSKSVLGSLESKVASQITTAAAKVGIEISASSNGWSVKAVNNGTTVASSSNVIKQTGAPDFTTTVVMSAMFVGAVAVCGVVAKKRKLFAIAEA